MSDAAGIPGLRKSKQMIIKTKSTKSLQSVKNVGTAGISSTITWSTISTLLGVLLFVTDPYKSLLRSTTTFEDGSSAFKMWLQPDSRVFLKTYIFNITNKDAFLQGKEKLKVEEVGPFVYHEIIQHLDPRINEENGTISFIPSITLAWDPNLNKYSEDLVLVLPNVAILLFAEELSQHNFLVRMAGNTLFTELNSSPIIEQTAKEFMFGYQDDVLYLTKRLLSNRINFDKIGLIDRMYDLTNDMATAYTGKKNPNLAGAFASYNHLPYLPQWKPPCDIVDGSSDAVKFPSNMRRNQTLYFYRKSLCRSIPMDQVGDETVVDGLKAVVYKFRDDALDNGATNFENKCFCRAGKCLPSGLIDHKDCSSGFAIALSYPHFYNGDESLVQAIDGLKPEKKLHETHFTINPETGALINTAVRMQINVALSDVSGVRYCEKFAQMVVPMLWLEISVDHMQEVTKYKVIFLVNILPWIITTITYALLLFGTFFCIKGVRLLWQRQKLLLKKYEDYDRPTPLTNQILLDKPYTSFWERKRLSFDQNREMQSYYHSLLHHEEEDE